MRSAAVRPFRRFPALLIITAVVISSCRPSVSGDCPDRPLEDSRTQPGASIEGGVTDVVGHADEQLRLMSARLLSLNTGQNIGEKDARYRAAIAALDASVDDIIAASLPDFDSLKPDQLGRRLADSYRNLRQMATAFRIPDSRWHGSGSLRATMEDRLRLTNQHVPPSGAARPGNWFYWIIGSPINLGPALLLLEGHIDPALHDASVAALGRLEGYPILSGANSAWEARNQLYLALLERNTDRMDRAAKLMHREMTIGEGGTGLLEDYSFQFHGRLLHTAGYGGGYAHSAAEFAWLTRGTRWAVPEWNCAMLARHLVEHAQWVIVGGHYDLSVRGRITEQVNRAGDHLSAMLLLGDAGLPNQQRDEVWSAAAGLLAGGLSPTIPGVAALADWSKRYVSTPEPLDGFRFYWASDFAVRRTKDWYASVRMYSDRLVDYEFMTGLNSKGWFLAYGLTYISRTGDELWRDGSINKNWDWERLPGTTTRLGVHPATDQNTGTSSFAGGAYCGVPDSGGVCAFVLEPAAGDYVARKSYHFFEEGFLAVGSAINATAQRSEPVITTVTQWAAEQSDTPLILSGDRTFGKFEGQQQWRNVSWAWYDGIGYIFLKSVTLHGQRHEGLVTLWLDHGASPKDAEYAYVVLPKATLEETMAMAAKAPGKVDQVSPAKTIVSYGRATDTISWSVDPPVPVGQTYISRRYEHPDALFGNREFFSAWQCDETRRIVRRSTVPGAAISLIPREDGQALQDFRVEVAILSREAAELTVHLPPGTAHEPHQFIIRGPKGHERVELTSAHLVKRLSADSAVYRWQREGQALGETSFRCMIYTRTNQASQLFDWPAGDD